MVVVFDDNDDDDGDEDDDILLLLENKVCDLFEHPCIFLISDGEWFHQNSREGAMENFASHSLLSFARAMPRM